MLPGAALARGMMGGNEICPNLGPELLVEAGTPLVDGLGPVVMTVKEGTAVTETRTLEQGCEKGRKKRRKSYDRLGAKSLFHRERQCLGKNPGRKPTDHVGSLRP
jgi:uncharacterized membrane-anchored protein